MSQPTSPVALQARLLACAWAVRGVCQGGLAAGAFVDGAPPGAPVN